MSRLIRGPLERYVSDNRGRLSWRHRRAELRSLNELFPDQVEFVDPCRDFEVSSCFWDGS